jgi:hypothetical protein
LSALTPNWGNSVANIYLSLHVPLNSIYPLPHVLHGHHRILVLSRRRSSPSSVYLSFFPSSSTSLERFLVLSRRPGSPYEGILRVTGHKTESQSDGQVHLHHAGRYRTQHGLTSILITLSRLLSNQICLPKRDLLPLRQHLHPTKTENSNPICFPTQSRTHPYASREIT